MNSSAASSYSIRPVNPDDLKPLAQFFEANNHVETTRQFNPFPLTVETARWIVLEPHQDCYFVAATGTGGIIGFGMLRGWDEGYEIPSFGILVGAAIRGNGIGRELISYAIETACERDCPSIRLSVYEDNTSAIKFYKGLGFVEAERQLTEVLNRETYKIIMLKEL